MTGNQDVCRLEISDDTIDFSNDRVRISYHIRLGTIELLDAENSEVLFKRSYIQVHTDKQVLDSRKMTYKSFSSMDFDDERAKGKALVLRLSDPEGTADVNIRLTLAEGIRGYWCTVQYRRKKESCSLISIDPFVIDIENESRLFLGWNGNKIRMFKNGFHSWELSHAKKIESGENKSHLFSALTDISTKKGLIIGFTTAIKQLSSVTVYGRDKEDERLAQIVASVNTNGIDVSENISVISEELFVLVGDESRRALEEYVEQLAASMKAISWERVPFGWCSWYFYYTMPDEGEILTNTRFLQERFGNELEWIQIDDGFQKAVGDWEENSRFPTGLKSLSKKIEEMNFKSGIWTAPFVASEHSEIFKDRPDWFVRDNDNKPIAVDQNPLWLGNYYALDLTNPQVLEYIENLFRRLKGYGFQYFKIDFLYFAAVNGRRHDQTVTFGDLLRRGLEAVRKGVGDALILGCGAPIGECIGIVNAMRIGTDIATAWRYDWGGGVYECAVNTMSRAVFHNRLWINDPDCILVRQEDNDLTLDEIHLWLNLVALSGGILMLSDRMEEVSEERLSMIDKMIPIYPKGAIAIDALTEENPRVFALPIETPFGRWAVVSVSNLNEEPIDIRFSLEEIGLDESGPCHVFNFWDESYEGIYEKTVSLRKLPSHSSKLFAIKPEELVPSLLSTSIHFTQGAVEIGAYEWNSKTNELELTVIRSTRKAESIFVVFGGTWKPMKAYLNDQVTEFHSIAPEVISINQQFKKGQAVRISFTNIR